jgi:hypothetical protein
LIVDYETVLSKLWNTSMRASRMAEYLTWTDMGSKQNNPTYFKILHYNGHLDTARGSVDG